MYSLLDRQTGAQIIDQDSCLPWLAKFTALRCNMDSQPMTRTVPVITNSFRPIYGSVNVRQPDMFRSTSGEVESHIVP